MSAVLICFSIPSNVIGVKCRKKRFKEQETSYKETRSFFTQAYQRKKVTAVLANKEKDGVISIINYYNFYKIYCKYFKIRW